MLHLLLTSAVAAEADRLLDMQTLFWPSEAAQRLIAPKNSQIASYACDWPLERVFRGIVSIIVSCRSIGGRRSSSSDKENTGTGFWALHAVEWPGTVILAHPLEGEEDPLDTYTGGSAAGGTRRMSGSGGRGRRNAASSQVAVPWLIADRFDWWNGSS